MVTGWLALWLLASPGVASVHAEVLPLGDEQVSVVVHEQGASALVMVNLHDNEDTSVLAGLAVVEERGGRLVELRHTGERWIRFRVGPRQFRFDPNRMFSTPGIRASLAEQTTARAPAVQAVEDFARRWRELSGVDRAAAVVALHNNSKGGPLTVHSYQPGGTWAADARHVYVDPAADADDFILVTREDSFQALLGRGVNVVLQDNQSAADDGSLSVYCARQGIPYANVEAQEGHLRQQEAMLRLVLDVLTPP